MRRLNLHRYKRHIIALATLFVLASCRTTTRTKTTAESEEKTLNSATEQIQSATIDSVTRSTVKDVVSEVRGKSSEKETETSLRITEITQRETFFGEFQDQPKSGMSVHPPTGRVIETTKRITEQQNIVREREILEYKMTIERMRSDSTALVKSFESKLNELYSENLKLKRNVEEFEKKKQVCFPCYLKLWWLWLIVLLVILGVVFRGRLRLIFGI
jgi:hypothetical protein